MVFRLELFLFHLIILISERDLRSLYDIFYEDPRDV